MIPLNAVVVAGLPKNLPNRYTRGTQQFPRVILVPFNGSHWVPSKRLGMLLKALKLSLEIEKVSPAPAEKIPSSLNRHGNLQRLNGQQSRCLQVTTFIPILPLSYSDFRQ